MSEKVTWLESVLGECNHSQATKGGTLDSVNPYSGECLICGRIVLAQKARKG